MKKYGLIGYPLSHSFSPAYFDEKFKALGLKDHEYKAYPIQHVLEVEAIIASGVIGFNVTIPYKEDILDMLDEMDECASNIKAVNCVKLVNGKLIGYNTDEYGFKCSLIDQIGEDFDGKALVLGTGGASKAIVYVLASLGIEHTLVSRRQGLLNYTQVTEYIINQHKLIINTTPLGMYPKVDQAPDLPYSALSEEHYLYDLVYNPELSKFLNYGLIKGASIKNGKDMLALQAEKSWEIWTNP